MSKKRKECFIRETGEQRQWIIRRDHWECQFIDPIEGSKCRNHIKLEVHHIVPVIWAYVFLKWTPEQVNAPENLITLCSDHHQNFIHPKPDLIINKKLLSKNHKSLSKKGIRYWQDRWDKILLLIAQERTLEYLSEHPDDPYPSLLRSTGKEWNTRETEKANYSLSVQEI